jgi:hypothetical protein
MKTLASAVVALPLLFCHAMMAQDAPVVHQGTTEIAAFIGSARDANGFKIMGGGNLAYAITRRVMLYGEFTYFPEVGGGIPTGGGFTIPQGGVVSYAYTPAIDDIHGGIHIRIPIKEHHVVPYLAAGVGVLRFTPSTFTATVYVPGVSQPFTFPGLNADAVTKAAANFGGGLRFYFNGKFGMRLEGKAYKAADTDVFGKITIGFFYQIH